MNESFKVKNNDYTPSDDEIVTARIFPRINGLSQTASSPIFSLITDDENDEDTIEETQLCKTMNKE